MHATPTTEMQQVVIATQKMQQVVFAIIQDVDLVPEASWSLDLVTSVEHNVRPRSLLTIQLFLSWTLRESASRSQRRHSHGHILGALACILNCSALRDSCHCPSHSRNEQASLCRHVYCWRATPGSQCYFRTVGSLCRPRSQLQLVITKGHGSAARRKLGLDLVPSHGKWQTVTCIFQVNGLESR